MSANPQIADPAAIRESKLTLVERLADDLAHEIKNPLHSMVINLEVLRRRLTRLEADNSEELLRYTGVLNSELERVSRRVDLLLRMVRSNREADDPATLAEVLDELVELVQLECERHDVALELELPPQVDRPCLPRASTRQMLLSLILETLDAVPAGGVLQVRSETLPDQLRLRFQGLADTTRHSAATPPHEEENPSLAVARAIAEKLGGTLHSLDCGDAGYDGSSLSLASGFVLSLPRG